MKRLAIWTMRDPLTTKVSIHGLAEVIHDRNHLARSLTDSWTHSMAQKKKHDIETRKADKRQQVLDYKLGVREKELAELTGYTDRLIAEIKDLQSMIKVLKRDEKLLITQLRDKSLHAKRLSSHVSEMQADLDEMNQTVKLQQELLEEIKWSRKTAVDTSIELTSQHRIVSQQRDDAQRAVIHLTSLISSQIAFVERVMSSLLIYSGRFKNNEIEDLKSERSRKRRSFSPLRSSDISRKLTFGRQSPSQSPPKPAYDNTRRHTTDFSQALTSGRASPVARMSQFIQLEDADGSSFADKVNLVTEIVHKITEQCNSAIKDLAATERLNIADLDEKLRLYSQAKSTTENQKIRSRKDTIVQDDLFRRRESTDDETSIGCVTPSLDSRASTAFSGSIRRTYRWDEREESPLVQTTVIVEETETAGLEDERQWRLLELRDGNHRKGL